MSDWKRTHTITANTGEQWRVMLIDELGAAPTRAEWETTSPADWELVHGEWRFQGQAAPPGCESIYVRPAVKD